MKTPTFLVLILILLSSVFSPQLQAVTTLKVSDRYLTPKSTFQVIFDQAIITDEEVGKTEPNNLITITPHIPGNIHWKAGNIAQFVPSAPLAISTTYTFQLKSGLTDINGKKLPSIKLKTIESKAFTIEDYTRNSQGLEYTRQPTYYVSFNDAVHAEDVARYFVFKNKDGLTVTTNVHQATLGEVKSKYYLSPIWKDLFQASPTEEQNNEDEAPSTVVPNGVIILSLIHI